MIRMNTRRIVWAWVVAVCGVTVFAQHGGFAGDFRDAWGPRYDRAALLQEFRSLSRFSRSDAVHRWNEIALDANALDHTPVAAGDPRLFGEQIGPGRTARALAIVHIAIFDAVNAITGGYESYTGLPPVRERTSLRAAVAQAAHDTLAELYPSQSVRFASLLEQDLSSVQDRLALVNGIDLGRRAATAILAFRGNDGSDHPEPRINETFVPSNQPGWWRQDPVSQIPLALGAHWDRVAPFVLGSATQLPHPPPPALTSPAYTSAFDEVKRLGGDGIVTPTRRTADQTIAGVFWGYDGTPGVGTPPRLYNQIALAIGDQQGASLVDLARLLALVNVSMADAGIACWAVKYHHQFWRPVTGIREADPGTGPTRLGDGNPDTVGDPMFTPKGAPLSNAIGSNFTPPFPAYSSGHATFGGALFETLRNVYRTDRIAFMFVSDEFNGVTTDNTGRVRPRIRRWFASLSAAEEENGQSRIYLGIHWAFDKTEGISHGRAIADYVFAHSFRPSR